MRLSRRTSDDQGYVYPLSRSSQDSVALCGETLRGQEIDQSEYDATTAVYTESVIAPHERAVSHRHSQHSGGAPTVTHHQTCSTLRTASCPLSRYTVCKYVTWEEERGGAATVMGDVRVENGWPVVVRCCSSRLRVCTKSTRIYVLKQTNKREG